MHFRKFKTMPKTFKKLKKKTKKKHRQKICIDQGSKLYSKSFKKWLEDNKIDRNVFNIQ